MTLKVDTMKNIIKTKRIKCSVNLIQDYMNLIRINIQLKDELLPLKILKVFIYIEFYSFSD